MRLSLRNRLTLVFFAITFVAIAVLYVYIAPGLQSRLVSDKLRELATQAQRTSGLIADTVGSPAPASVVQAKVNAAGLASGARVTLLLVAHTPEGLQLSPQADSSKLAAAESVGFRVPRGAAQTGLVTTGTESSSAGSIAEAAYPVAYLGRVGAV